MPTYKNNRSGAIHLTTHSTNPIRTVLPGEEFVAHPDEVPGGLLRTKVDNKTDKMMVEKISDSPEVPAPRRPAPAGPAKKVTIEQLRDDIRRSSLETEAAILRMRQESAEEVARATETAAKAAAQASKSGKDAAKTDAGKPADKPTDKDAAKDAAKS